MGQEIAQTVWEMVTESGIRLGVWDVKSGRETQRGGLGSSHTILGNLSFIYGQRDAQEGFRAGSAVIRSMLFLKALLRLNFSINLGAFERWCWRRLLRITWVARRSNQSILKIHQPWIFFGRTDSERLRAGGKRGDKGWDGITNSMDMDLSKFWDSEGESCSPWGHKESDMT